MEITSSEVGNIFEKVLRKLHSAHSVSFISFKSTMEDSISVEQTDVTSAINQEHFPFFSIWQT